MSSQKVTPGLPTNGKTHPQAVRMASRGLFTTLPGLLLAALPVGICPICWPVYAGLLASLGLGVLPEARYMLPLTLLFLILALAALAHKARTRHGHGPLFLGLVATALVVLGKFALNLDPVLYLGIALLLGASIWNSWPRRKTRQRACPACQPDNSDLKRFSINWRGI